MRNITDIVTTKMVSDSRYEYLQCTLLGRAHGMATPMLLYRLVDSFLMWLTEYCGTAPGARSPRSAVSKAGAVECAVQRIVTNDGNASTLIRIF